MDGVGGLNGDTKRIELPEILDTPNWVLTVPALEKSQRIRTA